jgi:hypothetical protein
MRGFQNSGLPSNLPTNGISTNGKRVHITNNESFSVQCELHVLLRSSVVFKMITLEKEFSNLFVRCGSARIRNCRGG